MTDRSTAVGNDGGSIRDARAELERPPSSNVDDAETKLPELFGGRYALTREIGRDGIARERFLREIEIAARLRHPRGCAQ